MIQIIFILLGALVALVYYLDCWKPEKGGVEPKSLLKIKGILYFLSIQTVSGLVGHYGGSNQAWIYYTGGFVLFLVIYLISFPLVIAYAEAKRSDFTLRAIKTLVRGIGLSLSDIEQNRISELQAIIDRKNVTSIEAYGLLDGLLSHLYDVEEEEEQRTELAFRLLLERYLALLLTTIFEENGQMSRYRASIFYHENGQADDLEYFVGTSKSNQDKHSKNPLPLKKSIGGDAFTNKEIIVYPCQQENFQNREHCRRYESFIVVPIGIGDDVEGILAIDCIDQNHRFNDPGIQEFLTFLSSVLYLAGNIYRID